jgi:hypothetical protein
MKNIYSDFLANTHTYAQTEQFWQSHIQALLGSLFFMPYLKRSYGNGKKIQDGNPIFNAFFPSLHKAIRIIQIPNENESPYFSAWLDSVEIENKDVSELVIELELSDQTLKKIDKLVKMWVLDTAQSVHIENLIEELNTKNQEN